MYDLRVVLDPLLAVCILAVISIGFIGKSEIRLSFEKHKTREYAESNFMAYGGIVLLDVFLWNWASERNSSLGLPWLWIVV